MSIFDYVNHDDRFYVSKEDIEKEFNRINPQEKRELSATFTRNTEIAKARLEELEDASNLNAVVQTVATGIDLFAQDSLLLTNELTKVDAVILASLLVEFFIGTSDLPYAEYLMNEYESKLCMVLSEIYDFKDWNSYKLFKNRKEFFGKYLNANEMDVFLENARDLIAGDVNSSSFTYLSEKSPIVVADIFNKMEVQEDLSVYFDTIIDTYKDVAIGLSSEHYKQALEEDTFEKIAKERKTEVLFCPKCGNKIEKGSIFCSKCGTKVKTVAMEGWGDGIPVYEESDIMTDQDVYEFVMEFLFQKVIKQDGYEIVTSNRDRERMPSFVLKKDNELIFLLVEGGIAPHHPSLSWQRKKAFVEHAVKYHAKCLYAAVSIGATDAERFEAGLALKNDAYYFNFTGFEPVIYIK